jgi:hypothetical protein
MAEKEVVATARFGCALVPLDNNDPRKKWRCMEKKVEEWSDMTPLPEMHCVLAPKLPFGQLRWSPGAWRRLRPWQVLLALARHVNGDWGHVSKEVWEANDRALRDGFRISSRYSAITGGHFRLVTVADRSATYVVYPENFWKSK